nr:HNH endonuclease [Caballeronia sp. BR00000012568055]
MSGCWLWTGPPRDDRRNQQYGVVRVNGPQIGAHRAAWLLYRGDIPGGLHVLHRCDNPACINPAHLFLGTNLDNVADRVRKGRSGFRAHPGDTHPMAKLKATDVAAIRKRLRDGERNCDLADEYGVSRTTISNIAHGDRWKVKPQ